MTPSTYKPSAPTTSAIRTAIALAQRDAAAVEDAMHVAKRERDGLLLDGSGAALARAENALAETRGDVERLDAIRAALAERLTAATRAEELATVAAAESAVSAANQGMNTFWQTEGETLARLLGHALEHWEAGNTARVALRAAQLRGMQSYPADADRIGATLSPIVPLDDATTVLVQMLLHSPFAPELAATASPPEPTPAPRLRLLGGRKAG